MGMQGTADTLAAYVIDGWLPRIFRNTTGALFFSKNVDDVGSQGKTALTGNEGLSEEHHGFEGWMLVVKERLSLKCGGRTDTGGSGKGTPVSCAARVSKPT